MLQFNVRVRQSRQYVACVVALMLAACGGGGGSIPAAGIVPAAPGGNTHAPSPSPAVSPTPVTTTTPVSNPTPVPTSTPGGGTTSSSVFPSTTGQIALFQAFDYSGGYMPQSEIQQYAPRFDAVWASVEPAPWDAAHPGMLVSEYFIMGLDQYSVTGHSLSWWQANHPDWILYACTSSGAPTHDVAYMNGINVPDVPLDIHNPSVVDYQVGSLSEHAKSSGYNSLAIDQVVFWNIYLGGNPNFGQTVKSGEYGCGIWEGSTFVRRYSSPSDSHYASDVVQYARTARAVAHSYGLKTIINHPAGSVSSAYEQEILQNTDVDMDETGFSDYGKYPSNPGLFQNELAYVRYAQAHGTAMMIIDKFANETSVDANGLQYSIATYLLGNEGALLLFVGGLNQYGTIQYHPEYDGKIGRPCSDVGGGPYVYTRQYSGALVVVNASTSTQTYSPSTGGKTYRDVVTGGSVSFPLTLAPSTSFVLLSSSPAC